jgi:AcrR family transcriptional regulator
MDARVGERGEGTQPGEGPGEPLTARGIRTRDRLLVAARQVFEERGYHDARVTDISKAAGVAHGTFYTYFESKEDVFRQVLRAMQHEMHAVRSPAPPGMAPAERIAHANRGFFEAYRRNVRMMAVLEQVASFEDDLHDFRREMRALANLRSSRAIARWQAQGLVDPELDARYVASALGSMVDRSLYVWLVLGEPFDEEEALLTLNTLCIRALGLDRATPAASRSAEGTRRRSTRSGTRKTEP